VSDTKSTDPWHVYVLECADDTLYTGITTELARRVREHNESPKGARYTRARRPVELAAAWSRPDRSGAANNEAAFKSLSRGEKLRRLAVGSTPEALAPVADRYADAPRSGDPDVDAFRPLRLVENDRLRAALAVREQAIEVRDALAERAPHLDEPAPEPILFDGPGRDGDALIVDESPVVFFDAALLARHFGHSGYAPRVHAAHEWAHGLHYANTPAFAPGNRSCSAESDLERDDSRGASRRLRPPLRRLVAEGLACRAAAAVTDCGPRRATWFGLLDDDAWTEWRDRARERRSETWKAVADPSAAPEKIDRRLFALGESRVDSRHGYWYGFEIVGRAARDRDAPFGLFAAAPEEWRARARSYFEEP